tara:strand:- start:324 stop:1313 length:990 start_codon:yes stop_codon:yes gene_type:complete
MLMKDYISDFSNHLIEAMKIGENKTLKNKNLNINNVLIAGLGGSGIGGSIIADVFAPQINIPILISKDYSIPNFVNKNTLVIASSYSGNTEETIYAVKKALKMNAEVAIITSGGILKEIAEKNNLNKIYIPGGHPPRAMFGYSFTQLFYLLNHYNVIDLSFVAEFKKSISLLVKNEKNIKDDAHVLAKNLYNKTPVIYVAHGFEGVATRFRQQLNENSKMLCWHHVIPEMNHNELLGWRVNVDNLAVVFFRNELDNKRNKIRIEINKEVVKKHTKDVYEVVSRGDSVIQNTLYHIHFGDWVSWYLSELNDVDAIEIDVINYLKKELAKF